MLHEDPNNPNLLNVLNQGFKDAYLLDGRMSLLIKEWLCGFHNRFHGGSMVTLAEKFEFKDGILTKWKCHAEAKGICARNESGGESYQTKLWKFVVDERLDEGKFESSNEFRRACTK